MHPVRIIEDARSVCRDLSEVFAQEGDFSEDTLEEVRRLCEIARLVIDDRFCQYELQEVERYAGHLLGDTSLWGQGYVPGHVYLRELIDGLLAAVDLRLQTQALRTRSANVRFRAMVARQRAREVARAQGIATVRG